MSYDILNVAARTAEWLTLGWGLSSGLAEVANLNRFVTAVMAFGVLPKPVVRAYCICVIGGLLIGSGLAVTPAAIATTLGCSAVATVFTSFAIGAYIAGRREQGAQPISCGCLGGHLASDLTKLTWLLPGGLAATIWAGVFTGRFHIKYALDASTLIGLVCALGVTVLLVLATEGAAAAARRKLWLRMKLASE